MALATALVTAASLMGDTFLYTVLPVSAATLGIAPVLVGLILSVNRWVRLATNPLAARLYERVPAGRLVVIAIVLAAVSTALYAEPAWIVVLLAARLLWGFCWSLLRLGSYLAAIDGRHERAGRALGETRAVFGIGYLAGAIYAPFAVAAVGWHDAILGAALLTLAGGLGPALAARAWRRAAAAAVEMRRRASVREPRLALLFAVGGAQLAMGAGILVVAGGLRIAELYPGGAPVAGAVVPALFIAAAFVLTQRIAQVAWQPLAGRLADRDMDRTFIVCSMLTALAALGLALPVAALAFIALGVVANFSQLASAIATELAVARASSGADRPRILAAFHTGQDAGAAIGALAGGALAAVGTSLALSVGAALMLLTLPLWWGARRAEARRLAVGVPR